ncbi:MAG: tetratricopeptide repeat protein [Microcoleaceae cyanobacterium]
MSTFKIANELLRMGKLSEAIQAYHQVIEQQPNFAYAYHNLGEALAQQGELQAATVAYQKAIEINPELRLVNSPLSLDKIEHYFNPAEAYNTIAQQLQNQGDFENAIAFYQQSIQLQGNAIHLESYRHLGEALLALAESSTPPEQFLNQIQQQIEQYPTSWELYYCLGEAWINLNQNQAVTCYQQAIKINLDAIPAYYKLIELQPYDPEIYQQLAAAFERQNQPNEAAIARLLATYPETQPPRE